MRVHRRAVIALILLCCSIGAVWLMWRSGAESPADLPALPGAATRPAPVDSSAPPEPPASVPVREVRAISGWQLKGINLRADGTGSAILASADGTQSLFAEGRAVAPGTRILKVYADRVRLQDQTGPLDLLFEQPELGEASAALADRARAAPLPAKARFKPDPDDSKLAIAASQRALRLALRPVSEGGQTSGYQLTGTTGLPLFVAAGLQAGDIIREINDSPFDDAERIDDLPYDIQNSKWIRISFERQGRLQTVTIDLLR